MKFKYFLILLMLILTVNAFAQTFKGGFTGGLNAARIDGDTYDIYGKLGLNAGAFVSREILSDFLDWQLELKYTSRGRYQGPTPTFSGIDLISLTYAELPLSLQLHLNEKIQIELGLSPDVLLKEYYEDENGPVSPEYANELRRFGITAFAGVNYFFITHMSVGMRFNYSALPFYKFDAYAVRYRDSGWFHDVLSINLKYYLVHH